MRTVRTPWHLVAAALLLLPALAGAQVVINEIRIDQGGTDNDEYFELFGPANQSLAGLTYLVIGDATSGGIIEEVTTLAGNLDATGYFLAAESTFTLAQADLTTDLNFENTDNVTHMLVSGFSGALNDDLDTNDDGAFDVTPWTAILDCTSVVIALQGQDPYYCTTVGPDGTFAPGHVIKCPNGSGQFVVGLFAPGLDDTPGAENTTGCPEDCDDGIDNDVDGQTDCLDPDCAGDPACVAAPGNDLCATPTAVGPGVFPFTTLGASTDGPIGCGGGLEYDVWFLFAAPCTGPSTFRLCGTASAGFNPQMAIYDAAGGCPTTDSWVACAAGGCVGSNEPEIIFGTVAGQSYYIQVGGFQGTRGTATLTVECPPADCHVSPNPNFRASYVAETSATNAPAAAIGFVPALDSIVVGGVGIIQDVDVQVNVTHPFLGDLIIDLISPSSTQIRLHNVAGGSQFDMDVRFDDEGAAYDTVPFFGGNRMQPFEALTAFDGSNADGGWAITALDTFLTSPADPPRGTLDSWTLSFFTPLPIPDASPAGLLATIDVPASNTDGVLDLDVALDIAHGGPAQVSASVTSPAGTTVTLHSQGSTAGLAGRFDDDPLAGGVNDGFGTLIPTGPGDLADFDGQFIAGTWSLVAADNVAGTTGTLRGWDLLVCPAPCVGISGLAGAADCAADTVSLTWTNGDLYSNIEVLRDGSLLATISGLDESFVDVVPLDGFHQYTIRALCAVGAREASVTVNHFGYGGEGHIVLQLEGLVDFGDPGTVDSGAAIEAALIANGITDVKRVRIDPDAYPCLTAASVDSIWVAAGTFPFNYLISTSEGEILGDANAAGIALYLESSDHWGFSHDVSSLDGRDGVDDAIHNQAATDGDDTFTAMDGLDSGFGLDLDALANVAYTQDNPGFDDFTDQLLPATADGAGASAGAIWRLDDALGTPYTTGVHYDTNSGGKTIAQSWEFGGFGGDKNALMAAYIDALGLGAVGGGFRRADCNTDGLFNIADAVFVLAALFSGGSQGTCSDACDMNDDGLRNIADAIYGLARLFSGGAPPPAPFPDCGADGTPGDPLDCAAYNPPC